MKLIQACARAIIWWFRTILGVGLRIFSYFRGGLRLTNDGSVTQACVRAIPRND